MSCAFDSVSHELLMKKCCAIGVLGPPLDWIKSYLRGRTKHVAIDGHQSKHPRDSIKGPCNAHTYQLHYSIYHIGKKF